MSSSRRMGTGSDRFPGGNATNRINNHNGTSRARSTRHSSTASATKAPPSDTNLRSFVSTPRHRRSKKNQSGSLSESYRKTSQNVLQKSMKKSSSSTTNVPPDTPDRFVPQRISKRFVESPSMSATKQQQRSKENKKTPIESQFDQYLWDSLSVESSSVGPTTTTAAVGTPQPPLRRNSNTTFVFGSPSVRLPAPSPDPFAMDTLRSVKVRAQHAPYNVRAAEVFRFPTKPIQILDAVDVLDDFYSNLVDWHPETNLVAVALGRRVYMWDPVTGNHWLVLDHGQVEDTVRYVSCVAWCRDHHHRRGGRDRWLATVYRCTASRCKIEIIDTTTTAILAAIQLRTQVATMVWNGSTIVLGCADGFIYRWDPLAPHRELHPFGDAPCEGSISGLQFNNDATALASGGNDNLVRIWDARMSTSVPRLVFRQHCAAVKALAWCPAQSELIVSGGGTNDRHIHVWNSRSGAILRSVNTRNQVSTLQWTQSGKELISCHGYTAYTVGVWNFATLKPITTLEHHRGRILGSAVSPDRCCLATIGADEMLCFWKIGHRSESSSRRSTSAHGTAGLLGGRTIR